MATLRQMARQHKQRDKLACKLAQAMYDNCFEVADSGRSHRQYTKKKIHPEKLYVELWNMCVEHAEAVARGNS